MTEPAESEDAQDPLHAFRFHVEFWELDTLEDRLLCKGAFSEVSGLEATMEPVAIAEGGRNWGQVQRAGRTTFSTVILRRGMTTTRHLWEWFSHVAREGRVSHRLEVIITLYGLDNEPVVEWWLDQAMPVKLKLADLSAASQEVGIEELHLVHEGIEEELVASSGGAP